MRRTTEAAAAAAEAPVAGSDDVDGHCSFANIRPTPRYLAFPLAGCNPITEAGERP